MIMKILIAEDNPDIANLHKLVLEARGHRIMLALDGQKCLDAYYNIQNECDVVLLDHKMPIIQGIEVAKKIIKQRPKQRIILVTAQAKETLFNSMKELGRVIEIIEKPFAPELLVKIIEK